MYAIVDVETTGLNPGWHHRVVEVAVVQVDESGKIVDEWCSLVNPDRDLGPQAIHGISAAEARRAPVFAQLAGHLTERLRDRVLVAHNLTFDAGFLRAEYERAGMRVPVTPDAGLCTMRLASHFLPSAGRSLHDCCRVAGLPPYQAHSALHDARAAAHLLGYYVSVAGSPPPWSPVVSMARSLSWPAIPVASVIPVQRRSPDQREEHFLNRLVDRLPRLHNPQGDAYLDLLDRALLDRHISANEADALVATANEFGLARVDVEHLHRAYLRNLAAVALEDGIVTGDERRDLDQVAVLLGLQPSEVDRALDAAADESDADARRPDTWRLCRGDVVVFTGATQPPRDYWEKTAVEAGLLVGSSVTKQTRLLVAADPDSMSSKAKKARQYGIPIVHPTAYERMLADLSGRSGRSRRSSRT